MTTNNTIKQSLLPVLYISHGAPTQALDPKSRKDFQIWSNTFTKPTGILIMSAHYETPYIQLSSFSPKELFYDFYGFEDELYQIKYPTVDSTELGNIVKIILEENGYSVRENKERGLDHGAWVPLIHMYPQSVPIIEISIPSYMSGEELYELGGLFAGLREKNVLIVGSGNLTHNLNEIGYRSGKDFSWAQTFIDLMKEKLESKDVESIKNFNSLPNYKRSHPTDDHFVPLLFALGAAQGYSKVCYPIDGMEFGCLAKTSIQFD